VEKDQVLVNVSAINAKISLLSSLCLENVGEMVCGKVSESLIWLRRLTGLAG
jgi:hypothetical protein